MSDYQIKYLKYKKKYDKLKSKLITQYSLNDFFIYRKSRKS